MDVVLLSNVNIDSLSYKLSRSYNLQKPSGYNSLLGEIVDENSSLFAFNPDAVFCIVDGYELLGKIDNLKTLEKEISSTLSHFETAASSHKSITFFISNIDYPAKSIRTIDEFKVERHAEFLWYSKLFELSKSNSNVYIFDIKTLIEENGRKEFYSKKLWYLGNIKYSMRAQSVLEKEIKRYIGALEGKRKKCLVLDLDNTLWGGILGEEGIGGISLSDVKAGSRYKDFQKRIQELKNTGVVLSIVSKNNEKDALEVLGKHPCMVLRENDFTLTKINWETKPVNIEELAKELNIGLDSFVFIDDSPVERDFVKVELPSVSVPDFPKDTSELESFIKEVYCDYFLCLRRSAEDKNKTEMYKQNFSRAEAVKLSVSLGSYLRSLNTVIEFSSLIEKDIQRVSQLTNKTNQFNLTTKRYSEKDIRAMLCNNNFDIFTASVEDKFGKNGLVSVLIVDKSTGVANLDTFLMSCRVMGRFIEDQLIESVEKILIKQGFKTLFSRFCRTERNKPVENLFDRLGYECTEVNENGDKKYKRKLVRRKVKKYAELKLSLSTNPP